MDAKKVRLQGKIVKKSNALARARWAPDSVWEARLVGWLASQIKATDKDFQTYEIRIVDLVGNEPGGKDYKELEQAVDKAMSRVITIRNGEDWKKYTLFSSCEFKSKSGTLKVGFHPDLKVHYLELKQWVQYNLSEFLNLPSIYSQRIFEILKSWNDKQEVSIPLSDLHEMLETPKSLRSNFAEFRRRVLEKAKNDISKNTSFDFEWYPIKYGRAVYEIKFRFPKKRKQHISTTTKADSFLKEALGVEPKKSKQSKIHVLFLEFTKKFPFVLNLRREAWPIWNELYTAGKAPMAKDVPDDNELNLMEFLNEWQEPKMRRTK